MSKNKGATTTAERPTKKGFKSPKSIGDLHARLLAKGLHMQVVQRKMRKFQPSVNVLVTQFGQ